MKYTMYVTIVVTSRFLDKSLRLRLDQPKSIMSHNIFFFNDTATTEIYTLSLHDALPISFHMKKSQWLKLPAQVIIYLRKWYGLPTLGNTYGVYNNVLHLG